MMQDTGPETIKLLLEQLQQLSDRLGPVWTLLSLLLVVLLPTGVSLWRERHLRKAYEGTIEVQEKEIERLAADNAEWRRFFFQMKGLTEGEINKLDPPGKGKGSTKRGK